MPKTVVRALLLFVLLASTAYSETIRVPLVGVVRPPDGQEGTNWRTETRLVNRSASPATVEVTAVIGTGNPNRLRFQVPPHGVLDLPSYDFFTADVPFRDRNLLATLELSSDRPIKVYTAIHVSTLTVYDCVRDVARPLQPHWAGNCAPVGGPLLTSFDDYIQPTETAELDWLTAEFFHYRTNLFVTNPNPTPLTIRATFRPYDGSIAVERTYVIPARSLTPILDVFSDPVLEPIRNRHLAADPRQGAATASLRADGPFYVFAGTINSSEAGKDSTNRFVISQP